MGLLECYQSWSNFEFHFSETKNKFIPQNYLHDKSFNKYTLDGNNRRMNTERDSRTLKARPESLTIVTVTVTVLESHFRTPSTC